jgi:hypothetical protein
MKNIPSIINFTYLLVVFFFNLSFGQNHKDQVKGNLILFNDNGAWCWYQDERAVIDSKAGNIIVSSVASISGVGGSPKSGDLESVIYNYNTGSFSKYTLKEGGGSTFYCDDHNAPAFLVRPDGKYLTIYAGHFNDTNSYYRIYENGSWGAEKNFNWKLRRPGGSNFQTTYSNIYYLSAENRVYNFVRGNNKSPNFMYSTDQGDTWIYGGQLTTNANIGYNNGYYKYCSNGIDRIDFICTDYHPRDYNTSIFHGYIYNGKIYNSYGTQIDNNIFDTLNIPSSDLLTKVLSGGTVIGIDTFYRCWNTDVFRYEDGTIATIITARINNDIGGSSTTVNPEHAFFYCRFDGKKWNSTYLGKAGLKMYADEQDYTGLAAVVPNNPNIIYISSTYDPNTNLSVGVHEIFKGITSDNGKTWTWSPITQNSVRDNFRPIVPVWDNNNYALLWWRGTYTSAQTFDAAVVGVIEHSQESIGKMKYFDATINNTTLLSGSAFSSTGPDSNSGAADGKWHIRTGYGNNSTVFTSGELGGEDAQLLKTVVRAPDNGIYDIWVNFWGNPSSDWRIKAGLSPNNMRLFRSMSCKQVDYGAHSDSIIIAGRENTFLYQAYVGRITAKTGSDIEVFVDDSTVKVGTINTMARDIARTWYDGISIAEVNKSSAITKNELMPSSFRLEQNYPNPFNPSTKITFSIPKSSNVSLKVYDILGREVKNLVNGMKEQGIYNIVFDASGFSSGLYLYHLKVGNEFSEIKKMLLIR